MKHAHQEDTIGIQFYLSKWARFSHYSTTFVNLRVPTHFPFQNYIFPETNLLSRFLKPDLTPLTRILSSCQIIAWRFCCHVLSNNFIQSLDQGFFFPLKSQSGRLCIKPALKKLAFSQCGHSVHTVDNISLLNISAQRKRKLTGATYTWTIFSQGTE